jgi:hypothetical protein
MQVHLVTISDYEHHQSMQPFAEALRKSTEGYRDDLSIVVGSHLLQNVDIPRDWILYNSEQIGGKGGFGVKESYLALLKRHPVWDYSVNNIEALSKLGIEAKHCPVGYESCLSKWNILNHKKSDEDIDILFYGSVNERRKKILDQLSEECNLKVLFGVYGSQLDSFIARSKIILNLHFYEEAIFEIFRCSYLMANKKCIVSEWGKDQKIEIPYSGGIIFCSYESLVNACLECLANPQAREIKGLTGYEIFSNNWQDEYVEKIV